MEVLAAEDHLVVVDEPDVLVHNVTEVAQAPAGLVDEEADSLPAAQQQRRRQQQAACIDDVSLEAGCSACEPATHVSESFQSESPLLSAQGSAVQGCTPPMLEANGEKGIVGGSLAIWAGC